jgi:hypothetical protein
VGKAKIIRRERINPHQPPTRLSHAAVVPELPDRSDEYARAKRELKVKREAN